MQKRDGLSVCFMLCMQGMSNCLNQGGVYWGDMPCYGESICLNWNLEVHYHTENTFNFHFVPKIGDEHLSHQVGWSVFILYSCLYYICYILQYFKS